MSEEAVLWKGNPSQWLNLGPFVGGSLALLAIGIGGSFVPWLWLALLLPVLYLLWRWLVVRCQIFELTTERLRVTTGVVNQHIDEVELYRVKDIVMQRLWWMRLTGLASLVLQTSDRTLPVLVIPAIRFGTELRETLRKQVEQQRDRKRVRELDFDEADAEL